MFIWFMDFAESISKKLPGLSNEIIFVIFDFVIIEII
jgi:hypothetical protein